MMNFDFNKAFTFDLPKIEDDRGNLSFLEVDTHVPFPIKRVYWIYDVPGGQERGSHAFKSQKEIVIAISGSFDVVLNDGEKEEVFTLNRAYKALYIPEMTWRTLKNFSTNSVCLVLNSGPYMEGEYVRNYDAFLKLKEKSFTFSLGCNEFVNECFAEYNNSVYDCSLLEFPVIKNRAGNITAIESNKNIPFHIKRVFHIYDIPSEAERGMHAQKYCHELLVATTGSFKVELDDGINKRIVNLSSPKYGLHIPPGIWAKEKEYSSGATCLVLASEKYGKEGYLNSYQEFLKYKSDDKD